MMLRPHRPIVSVDEGKGKETVGGWLTPVIVSGEELDFWVVA